MGLVQDAYDAEGQPDYMYADTEDDSSNTNTDSLKRRSNTRLSPRRRTCKRAPATTSPRRLERLTLFLFSVCVS